VAHLVPEAVRAWAEQVLGWVWDRDVEALRKQLPPLLLACDERVLGSLWPEPSGHSSMSGRADEKPSGR